MLIITSRLEDPDWTCQMESNQQESGMKKTREDHGNNNKSRGTETEGTKG